MTVMTLTYFMTRSMHLNADTVSISLEGKTFRKLANGQNTYDSEKKTLGGLHQRWGYNVYYHNIHTYLLVYQ